ncbi:MAG: YtxH domain-containing protein [Enhygromyxa sp.]
MRPRPIRGSGARDPDDPDDPDDPNDPNQGDDMNLENLTNMSRMDLLRSIGLAPRVTDYILPALGIFAAGTIVGAGTALMLAPRSGNKLRRQIREEVRSKLGELEQLLEGDEKSEKKKRERNGRASVEHERGANKQAA